MLASRKTKIFLGIIAVFFIAGIFYYVLHRGQESTDDAQIESYVVPVSPKVGGYVIQILVKDNQSVKKGDALVKIDPRDYEIARLRAQAALKAAAAQAKGAGHSYDSTRITAPSGVESAMAQVAAAEAEYTRASRDLKRLQGVSSIARTRQQLDRAVAEESTARSSLEDAKARLVSAQTAPNTVAIAQSNYEDQSAELQKAQADLAEAEKNLADSVIVAPFDGKVTRRGVEQGMFVQPGQVLMSIVSDDYWVVANFKETQIEKMRVGQIAKIRIDAYPDENYEGKVDSLQAGTGSRFSAFPAENATGNFVKIVQRVPVKIIFTKRPPQTLAIGPGMSAVPTVSIE